MPDLPYNLPVFQISDDPQQMKDAIINTFTQIFDAFNNRSDSNRLTFTMPGDTTPVQLPGIDQSGSFFLRINNQHHMAPAGCFAIAKSDVGTAGSVEQIVFSQGAGPYSGVAFQLTWPALSAPTIALSRQCPPFEINIGVL